MTLVPAVETLVSMAALILFLMENTAVFGQAAVSLFLAFSWSMPCYGGSLGDSDMRRQWFPWRLWTWWNARRDRRYNLPSPEATALSETERQIQTGVNTAIRDAEQRYAARADPLEGTLAALREALRTIHAPEYGELQQKTGRRDVRIHIPHTTHLVLLSLLTVGETAFNLVAFNVLQEPAVYTMLMALAVGLAIPVCAWAMGVWVRQWPPPWWMTAAKLLVVTGVVVALLVGINRVRLAYLQEQAPTFVGAHPELNLAFFTVNIVVLVAAALVTYLAHDPEPGFAEAKAKLDQCRTRMRRIEGRLDQLANTLRTEVEMLKEAGWQLMAYYRMVNRRKRAQVPHYFDHDADKNYQPAFVDITLEQYHRGAVAPQERAGGEGQ